MGLAASQARLLMITMRINDCQYDLMKLSGETMRLNEESSDLDEKYGQKLSQINLSYDGNSDFSYGDLMGAAAVTAGTAKPTLITTSSNAVVFDRIMAQAARAAGLPEKGGTASYPAFGKFMEKITNDSETNWATVLTNTSTTTTTPVPDQRPAYSAAMSEFTSQYGTKPEAEYWVDDENSRKPREYEESDPYISERNNGNQQLHRDFIDDTSGGHMESPRNNKGYTLEQWTAKLQSFATQKGLDYNALLTGNYPDGKPNITTTTTPPDKNSDNYKKANFYYQIYSAAAKSGWSEDQQINSKGHLQAQLQNNTYKIGGTLAKENDKVKSEFVDKDAINLWYENALKKIKNVQKPIETRQTQIQTRLQAYTTEQQSVQSLIDKNIERSFTYCNA